MQAGVININECRHKGVKWQCRMLPAGTVWLIYL